jgi:hypothetical protein
MPRWLQQIKAAPRGSQQTEVVLRLSKHVLLPCWQARQTLLKQVAASQASVVAQVSPRGAQAELQKPKMQERPAQHCESSVQTTLSR